MAVRELCKWFPLIPLPWILIRLGFLHTKIGRWAGLRTILICFGDDFMLFETTLTLWFFVGEGSPKSRKRRLSNLKVWRILGLNTRTLRPLPWIS